MGISLEVISMDAPGCYVPQWKRFFVSERLSEEEMKLVILHEMKHAIDHHDYSALYKKSTIRIKLEAEANDYMIRKTIKENEGEYNYTQLIDSFRIQMGNDVKYCK